MGASDFMCSSVVGCRRAKDVKRVATKPTVVVVNPNDDKPNGGTVNGAGDANKPGAAQATEEAAAPHVDEAERIIMLQMSLKCADLGHICSPLPVHLKWVAALEEEMFRQGDREKEIGLPPSPLCDRLKSGIQQSQVGNAHGTMLP
jgi:hypothetical protein